MIQNICKSVLISCGLLTFVSADGVPVSKKGTHPPRRHLYAALKLTSGAQQVNHKLRVDYTDAIVPNTVLTPFDNKLRSNSYAALTGFVVGYKFAHVPMMLGVEAIIAPNRSTVTSSPRTVSNGNETTFTYKIRTDPSYSALARVSYGLTDNIDAYVAAGASFMPLKVIAERSLPGKFSSTRKTFKMLQTAPMFKVGASYKIGSHLNIGLEGWMVLKSTQKDQAHYTYSVFGESKNTIETSAYGVGMTIEIPLYKNMI